MKYGIIDFDLTVKSYWESSWNKKALLNIGDAAEYLVVEQILDSLGVDSNDMHRLSIAELQTYKGEKLIVPLNIALDSYVGYNTVLENLSTDIVPVFLGMSFTDTQLNKKQIECLRKYAPVGCRDERSYFLLKSFDIPCYLNGCTAMAIDLDFSENNKWRNKIVFIDVPYGVKEFVPAELQDEVVFLNQELYCCEDSLKGGVKPSEWAKSIFEVYSSKPKMIVSSRFHAAVLGIAKDIPVIVTLEKSTFRFSWIDNYYPIYTESDYALIDWKKAEYSVDFSFQRNVVRSTAKTRIQEVAFRYSGMYVITDIQKSKRITDEIQVSNQVFYYRRVWDEIQKQWDRNGHYKYGIWGLNDNSEMLYRLICDNYPNAEFVALYDMYKKPSYHGIEAEHPKTLIKYNEDDSFYVIVTAYLASRVAQDIFNIVNFPIERAFLCERDFITEEYKNDRG